MPSKETSPTDQRDQFFAERWRGVYTMHELCDHYSISRMTGYTWVARVAEESRAGLQDCSRAPHSCPHYISERVAALTLAAKRAHPAWGRSSCWIASGRGTCAFMFGTPRARPARC